MNKLLEKFYRENRFRLVKIMSNRAGSVSNAEDVVQDAFERALKYSNSFQPEKQKLGAWFNTILNNALRDFKVNERRMGMSVEYDERKDEGDFVLELEEDILESVKKDIAEKSYPLSRALYLYFFCQYKPRDIVQVLPISNTYVRTGVKEFKQQMSSGYGGG